MSHFAELDENNVVLRILVGDNSLPNEGHDWFIENLGGTWVQTSYNGNFRKNYASIGYTYDATRDAFIAPEPEGHIGFDEETCRWIMPDVEITE